MDKYIVTVETNIGEVVCIGEKGKPTLLDKETAEEYLKKYQLEFTKYNYRILRCTEQL